MFRSLWFHKLLGIHSRSSRRRQVAQDRRNIRLRLEGLEDRIAPATHTFNDVATPLALSQAIAVDGLFAGTLRNAVLQADSSPGANTIILPAGAYAFTGAGAGDNSNTASPTAVATHFLVVTPEDTQAGAPTPVMVVALDASNQIVTNYTDTVQLTSSDANATLPAAYTFQTSDHGRHVFQVTFVNTGSQSVTATDTTTSTITGTASTNVDPAEVATHFLLLVPEDVQAGQATPVTVLALDASNHLVPNYSGTVQLTSSDSGATLPAAYTFQASDHGRHTFQVTFATTGSQTVTATDTTTNSITGSVTVTVNPADVATHFGLVISPRNAPQMGQAVSVGVVALDASNHIISNYTGTVQLTSSDGQATLPAAYTFQASDHGRHIFQITFGTSGSQTVTATDTTTSSITGSVTANVNPVAVATHFGVRVLSDDVQVGSAVSIQVNAVQVRRDDGRIALADQGLDAVLDERQLQQHSLVLEKVKRNRSLDRGAPLQQTGEQATVDVAAGD